MNGAQNALTLEIHSLVCLSISFRVKFLENDKCIILHLENMWQKTRIMFTKKVEK